MSLPILTTLVVLPLAGGVAVLFTGKERAALARQVAFVVSLATFALSIVLAQVTRPRGIQFIERHSWLPTSHLVPRRRDGSACARRADSCS